MRKSSKKRKIRTYIVWLLLFCGILLLDQEQAYAESGSIYTCSITASYAHPVTGDIEDAGGMAGSVTGQGMVEGAVGTQGILEVTDAGNYYLTVRFSLMDYASGHEISVQNVGENGWTETVGTVTATGSDSSGSNEDLCIEVPSEQCILRCSMYVEPMGRDVIFYFYPDDYQTGNQTDMKATKVTETSTEAGKAQEQPQNQETQQNGNENADPDGGENQKATEKATEQFRGAEMHAEETADGETEMAGLSLSTASNETQAEAENIQTGTTVMTVSDWILALTVSMTLSGLLLLAAGTGVFLLLQRHPQWWKGDWEDD